MYINAVHKLGNMWSNGENNSLVGGQLGPWEMFNFQKVVTLHGASTVWGKHDPAYAPEPRFYVYA